MLTLAGSYFSDTAINYDTKIMSITERELSAIMLAFFSPRSYHQKEVLAKVFVMRWAIASGIDLNDPTDDPDDVRWCKP